jgi:hypothetical protein
MNWEAMGAIAELLGALGVVATLAYLAAQIKQNSTVVQTASFQELMEGVSRFTGILSQNAEAAEIYGRGIVNHDDLSESEKLRFHMLMSDLFATYQLGYQLEKRGMIDADLYAKFISSAAPMLDPPGIRQWWHSERHWWHDDFREFIDELVSVSNT